MLFFGRKTISYRIMVVDDSNIIQSKIERCGHESKLFRVVAKARNGRDAVSMYRKYRPDLVTMDLTMPEMDGIECIRMLKEIDRKARILVVSALTDKSTCLKALKYGALGFLSKPFTDEDFSAAIRKTMR